MPRKGAFHSSVLLNCRMCGVEMRVPNSKIALGWGKFCGRACKAEAAKVMPRRITRFVLRQLQPGEPLPTGKPRRYISDHGYVRLRWKVGRRSYIEIYEHRVGVTDASVVVHHVNGDKTDNRSENRQGMTLSEHIKLHWAEGAYADRSTHRRRREVAV